MFNCVECGAEYTADESPSDFFCEQYCQERWTDRISEKVEENDYDLDETARQARLRDGSSDPMDVAAFINALMRSRR